MAETLALINKAGKIVGTFEIEDDGSFTAETGTPADATFYDGHGTKVYVITEAARSSTCFLLHEEYRCQVQ